MKILAIIPARGGSKGIKNKNLIPLDKKPLIYYSINSALHSKFVSKTVVSSDNEKILQTAKKFGSEIVRRPKNLGKNSTKLEPVLLHTINYLQKKDNFIPDYIILLQNTSPLRNSSHIDNCMNYLLKNKFDSVLSVYPSHHFIWQENKKSAKAQNYNPSDRPNRQQFNPQFIENGAIYISTYDSFIKSKCRISGKIGLYKMKKLDSIEIDDIDDLTLTKTIKKMRKSK